MTRRIRFGVAGTAYWAREVHIPGLIGRPDIHFVGVWGRDREARRSIAEATRTTAFDSFDEMLASVDAVSFAVAPEAQPALAIAAAEAGKHLLLEKPLALSSVAGMQLTEAISRNGVASIVFFTRRFVPIIESAVELAATQRWHTASVRVHSAALSSPTPFAKSPWRQDHGAELWDIGPHALSILYPILGPVIRVEARRQPGELTTFASTHTSGATADVSLTLRANPADALIEYRFDHDGRSLTLPEPAIVRTDALSQAAGDLVRNIWSERSPILWTHRLGSKSSESSKRPSAASNCGDR